MAEVVYLKPGEMPRPVDTDYLEVHTYRGPGPARPFLSDITYVPRGRTAEGTFGDPVRGAPMTFPEAVEEARRHAAERKVPVIFARDSSAEDAAGHE